MTWAEMGDWRVWGEASTWLTWLLAISPVAVFVLMGLALGGPDQIRWFFRHNPPHGSHRELFQAPEYEGWIVRPEFPGLEDPFEDRPGLAPRPGLGPMFEQDEHPLRRRPATRAP